MILRLFYILTSVTLDRPPNGDNGCDVTWTREPSKSVRVKYPGGDMCVSPGTTVTVEESSR